VSRDPTARLFAALDLPEQACEELADWGVSVAAAARAAGRARGSLRLLPADVMHLTLCFLGSRPVSEIDALAATIPGCAGHACELALGAPVWLPARRPRSLAVEVHDHDGELGRLHDDLESALARACGWEPERRRFRAHVTVARVRGGDRRRRRGEQAEPWPELPPTPQASFFGESLTLYRSHLGPGGATYEGLARCSLLPAEV
jgi:RNA 2',3'-cyclic 3'-phosphodiesterase